MRLMTEEEWEQINGALCAAITLSLLHDRDLHKRMMAAGELMDDIANDEDEDED